MKSIGHYTTVDILKRFHFTCLGCRLRLWFRGKVDPTKFYRANMTHHSIQTSQGIHYTGMIIPHSQGKLIIPRNRFKIYTIILNPNVKFAEMKSKLIKFLLSLAEVIAK